MGKEGKLGAHTEISNSCRLQGNNFLFTLLNTKYLPLVTISLDKYYFSMLAGWPVILLPSMTSRFQTPRQAEVAEGASLYIRSLGTSDLLLSRCY
jgi:hypothetical protein